jgi:hypothetical protein
MGALVGGFLAIALFALIIERIAFKSDDPDARAMKTVGLAYAIYAAISLIGFGALGPLLALPGALVMFVWQRSTFRKAWSDD